MASPPPAPVESSEESSDEEYEQANAVPRDDSSSEGSDVGGSSYALADEVPVILREASPEPTPAAVMAVQPTLVSARMQAGLEIQV
jgi:hypothetical protein